jgi:Tol biopolymer transport system component
VTTDGIHTVDGRTPSGETRHLAFGIDKTAPTIVINTPLNGATYALGQQVRADYACIDAGSGIASGCVGTVANGALIDTSTLGSKTFTVSAATDNVGKVAPQKQVTYTVGYRKILFASTRDGNSEIYSMNLNGTNVTRLTNNPAEDASPVYSRDGRRILFTSTRTGNGDIYAMNPDGSGVVRLTSSTGVEALGDFSPDGSKIVFTSTKDGNAELYVMNADGTGQTRLTNNSAADADPVFSPSGTEIAWSSNRTSSTHDIYTATFNPLTNALGTATQRTTAAAPDTEPAWSTAGIAFVSQRDGNTEIYTMTSTGGSQTRRTTNTANDLSPAWSVDGTQILFASNRQGSRGFDIWSMTATGGSQTNRTTAAGSDTQPAW